MHPAELTGLVLVTSRALKAEHEQLPFEVYNFFIQLFSRFGPYFLQFFISFSHHHDGRRGGISSSDIGDAGHAGWAQLRNPNTMAGGGGGGGGLGDVGKARRSGKGEVSHFCRVSGLALFKDKVVSNF